MFAALISRYRHNGGVFPRDRSGREGHFEAIARELDGSQHLEDTAYSFDSEVESYELDHQEKPPGLKSTKRG
jgi:hypothetical protein